MELVELLIASCLADIYDNSLLRIDNFLNEFCLALLCVFVSCVLLIECLLIFNLFDSGTSGIYFLLIDVPICSYDDRLVMVCSGFLTAMFFMYSNA